MPKVGSKNFSYTPAGMKAAKAEAKRTGRKMRSASKPKKGNAMGMMDADTSASMMRRRMGY
jgi:hypothetical protein